MESKKDALNVRSSKSSESLCSLPSSKSAITRRRPYGRHSGIVSSSAGNEVRQRVVSARLLRMKNLQNQLNDALQHIANLSTENRLLKTIHKRQDSALSKYESSNAELPQLLQSHAEELRIWQAKYRGLHAQSRDLAHKLKQKDLVLTQLTDENKHLTLLNKNKNLEERETLSGRVHYLELRLAEKEEEIKLLERRNRLEAKNFKTQLAKEHQKHKELSQKLESTSGSTPGSGSGSNMRLHYNYKEANGTGVMVTKHANSFLPRPTSFHSLSARGNAEPANLKITQSLFQKENVTKEEHSECSCKSPATDIAAQPNGDEDLKKDYEREQLNSSPPATDAAVEEAIDPSSMNTLENSAINKASLPNGLNVNKKDMINGIINDLASVSLNTGEKENPQKSFQEQFAQMQNRAMSNDTNLFKLRSEIEEDIKKNEAILNSYCDSVQKDVEVLTSITNGSSSLFNAKSKLSPIVNPRNGQISAHHASRISKRTPIDPQKKNKLLAALKAIDSN